MNTFTTTWDIEDILFYEPCLTRAQAQEILDRIERKFSDLITETLVTAIREYADYIKNDKTEVL